MYFVYKLFYCMFKYTCLTIRPTGGIIFNWGRLPILPTSFYYLTKKFLTAIFMKRFPYTSLFAKKQLIDTIDDLKH